MPIVDITLIEGRPAAKKQAMIEKVTDAIQDSLGAPRESIRIIIREVPGAHFAVAGKARS